MGSQVHGAAEAALAAARSSVRSELAMPAPAPDRLSLHSAPVQLAEDLLALARRLVGVAAQSRARCALYTHAKDAVQARLLCKVRCHGYTKEGWGHWAHCLVMLC